MTVTNGADATAPAFFTILVDGVVVETIGPVAPGDSETVTLTGGGLGLEEDQTITVEVRSGGEIIDSSRAHGGLRRLRRPMSRSMPRSCVRRTPGRSLSPTTGRSP